MASNLRVDNIQPSIGTGIGIGTANGSVTFNADVTGGINVTGVTTATSFSGSGAGLTNIPAGQLTGALPAISGANLTGIVPGITEVDQWYMNANLTSNGDITSLARINQTGAAAQIGTGMSQSSGLFTFPSTGKWLIFVQASFGIDASDSCLLETNVTVDGGSNFTTVTMASDGNNGSGSRNGGAFSVYFLDVTDTSQVKVKFTGSSLSGASLINGESTPRVLTGFLFVRIGDT